MARRAAQRERMFFLELLVMRGCVSGPKANLESGRKDSMTPHKDEPRIATEIAKIIEKEMMEEGEFRVRLAPEGSHAGGNEPENLSSDIMGRRE